MLSAGSVGGREVDDSTNVFSSDTFGKHELNEKAFRKDHFRRFTVTRTRPGHRYVCVCDSSPVISVSTELEHNTTHTEC